MSNTKIEQENTNSWTKHAADSAHTGIDQTAERLDRVEQYLREQSSHTKDKIDKGQEQLQESLEQGLGQFRESTAKNPLMSVGIAFAAGALAGLILRK